MKRSKHSLSHYHNCTFDMGELVPIGCYEVLPGDTIQQATSAFVRVSPMVTPVMHPAHIKIHHWFVPYRLIWDDWEKFITGGPDGLDASEHPTITVGSPGVLEGSLLDYLGVPPGTTIPFSALPVRAYALIYNEWYRDQDLQSELVIDTTSGPDTTTSQALQNGAWEKDYFTTARPWTQKGAPVSIPIVGTAPVTGIGVPTGAGISSNQPNIKEADGSTRTYAAAYGASFEDAGPTSRVYVEGKPGATTYPNIFADLSESSAVLINELRTALAMQRWEEARARWGSRYTEYLAYLGIRSSDARLQRPEYLGGGRQTLQFSEIVQTGVDAEGEGVGNLKGHGIGALRSNRFRRFFEEHGVVVSLMCVRPRTMYVQGLARMWNRRVKEHYWQRELQHIGQEHIQNKELYVAHSQPDGTWGYQDRYDEYRHAESRISGEFRSTLDMWHMARIFASEPVLNGDFVKSNPTKRIHAVQTNDVLWCMIQHSIQARRLVAKVGTSFTF